MWQVLFEIPGLGLRVHGFSVMLVVAAGSAVYLTAWRARRRWRRAWSRAAAVLRSARTARTACQVLTAIPAISATATRTAVVRATRWRRAYFDVRYHVDGGHTSTGRSVRCRTTSAAKSPAVASGPSPAPS